MYQQFNCSNTPYRPYFIIFISQYPFSTITFSVFNDKHDLSREAEAAASDAADLSLNSNQAVEVLISSPGALVQDPGRVKRCCNFI